MATIKSKHTPKLSINNQHDYMTLRTPNGNFTCSYGGAKASGKIASAFRALDTYINKEKPEGKTFGEHFQTLLDPKVSCCYPAQHSSTSTDITRSRKSKDSMTGDSSTLKRSSAKEHTS